MSTEYTVDGVVRQPNGRPVSSAVVLVLDTDLGADDPVGATTTGLDGRFAVSADATELGGTGEGTPELRAYVFDGGERVAEESIPTGGGPVDMTVDRSGNATPSVEEAVEMIDESRHGSGLRGMTNTPRAPTHPGRGRFGRMFPYLEAADHDVSFLQELGLPGNELDERAMGSVADSQTPSGFVFVGQFIDHDITLDPLSSLSRQVDPDAIRNFRTPRLDLDSVYGSGPEVSRHLYESPFTGGTRDRLLLADDRPDLPRNREGTALVGDPRNDENHILSQFQYAMLNFHNRIFEWLPENTERHFERAQQLARWHYQWIVLEEYLPTVCDPAVVDAVREKRRHFTVGHDDEAYMPLEFAGAAYRFGHSQARLRYRINDEVEGRLFGHGPDALGMGFEPVSERAAVDWGHLFEMGRGVDTQQARKIDPLLAPDLLDLPFVSSDDDWRRSLASRNLVRGHNLGLPSGQAVARAMGVEPLSNAAIGFEEIVEAHGQPEDTETPLWYYVLAEAGELGHGEHLGPVGSRIVAEVIVGLIDSDPRSFLTIQPNWTPTLPSPCTDGSDDFSVADLLAFALGGG
jgi:hypothetical protein